ncbi:hypothetical protein HAX54_052020, partial [Datura stramonium]|nr:hypothetical protein [Datura stramonium]
IRRIWLLLFSGRDAARNKGGVAKRKGEEGDGEATGEVGDGDVTDGGLRRLQRRNKGRSGDWWFDGGGRCGVVRCLTGDNGGRRRENDGAGVFAKGRSGAGGCYGGRMAALPVVFG